LGVAALSNQPADSRSISDSGGSEGGHLHGTGTTTASSIVESALDSSNLPPHVAAFYAALRGLKLTPTNCDAVWLDRQGMPYNVPSPHGKTPEQCERIIQRLKAQMNWLGGD
jgi:hypothetical protein